MTTQITKSYSVLYEEDASQWLEETINLLKLRNFDAVDWDTLVEELDSMVRSEKNAVEGLLTELLKHLLVYQYWESGRSHYGQHWEHEILNFQIQLTRKLTTNLNNHLSNQFNSIYRDAKRLAYKKYPLPDSLFPETYSYDLTQIIVPGFLPKE
jgi:hypothetical protein